MSKQNVEVVRALVSGWNAGGRSVPTEYFDPAVELESPFASVSGEPYRGHAGMEQWVRDIDEQFAEWQIDLDDVREAGNTVIAIATLRGRGRASGAPFQAKPAFVTRFGSDDRITRARIYLDVNEALEDAGLSEQDAHAASS
jgi:ketosteroid isomerase-like protein